MATYTERKEDEAKWEAFVKRFGYEIGDIRIRTNEALLFKDRYGKEPRKAAMPPWLRDDIMKALELEQGKDKPDIKAVG